MTKILLILSLSFSGKYIFGQVQKIKVKKYESCEMNIIVSNKIKNDTLELACYFCHGLGVDINENQIFWETYKTKVNSITIVNKANLEAMFADICKIGLYSLHQLKATPLADSPTKYCLSFKYVKDR